MGFDFRTAQPFERFVRTSEAEQAVRDVCLTWALVPENDTVGKYSTVLRCPHPGCPARLHLLRTLDPVNRRFAGVSLRQTAAHEHNPPGEGAGGLPSIATLFLAACSEGASGADVAYQQPQMAYELHPNQLGGRCDGLGHAGALPRISAQEKLPGAWKRTGQPYQDDWGPAPCLPPGIGLAHTQGSGPSQPPWSHNMSGQRDGQGHAATQGESTLRPPGSEARRYAAGCRQQAFPHQAVGQLQPQEAPTPQLQNVTQPTADGLKQENIRVPTGAIKTHPTATRQPMPNSNSRQGTADVPGPGASHSAAGLPTPAPGSLTVVNTLGAPTRSLGIGDQQGGGCEQEARGGGEREPAGGISGSDVARGDAHGATHSFIMRLYGAQFHVPVPAARAAFREQYAALAASSSGSSLPVTLDARGSGGQLQWYTMSLVRYQTSQYRLNGCMELARSLGLTSRRGCVRLVVQPSGNPVAEALPDEGEGGHGPRSQLDAEGAGAGEVRRARGPSRKQRTGDPGRRVRPSGAMGRRTGPGGQVPERSWSGDSSSEGSSGESSDSESDGSESGGNGSGDSGSGGSERGGSDDTGNSSDSSSSSSSGGGGGSDDESSGKSSSCSSEEPEQCRRSTLPRRTVQPSTNTVRMSGGYLYGQDAMQYAFPTEVEAALRTGNPQSITLFREKPGGQLQAYNTAIAVYGGRRSIRARCTVEMAKKLKVRSGDRLSLTPIPAATGQVAGGSGRRILARLLARYRPPSGDEQADRHPLAAAAGLAAPGVARTRPSSGGGSTGRLFGRSVAGSMGGRAAGAGSDDDVPLAHRMSVGRGPDRASGPPSLPPAPPPPPPPAAALAAAAAAAAHNPYGSRERVDLAAAVQVKHEQLADSRQEAATWLLPSARTVPPPGSAVGPSRPGGRQGGWTAVAGVCTTQPGGLAAGRPPQRPDRGHEGLGASPPAGGEALALSPAPADPAILALPSSGAQAYADAPPAHTGTATAGVTGGIGANAGAGAAFPPGEAAAALVPAIQALPAPQHLGAPEATGQPPPHLPSGPSSAGPPLAACISHLHGYVLPSVGLPQLQPGQARVCGLTYDAAIAPAVRAAQTACQQQLQRSLEHDPEQDATQAHMRILGVDDADGSAAPGSSGGVQATPWAAAFARHKLSRNIICTRLARLLGLEGEHGAGHVAALPEGPVELQGFTAPCGDVARGGAGLAAAMPIKKSWPLGVVGGYVMPRREAAAFVSSGYRQCRPDTLTRLQGVLAGTTASVPTAWRLLAGAFRMPLSAGAVADPEGAAACSLPPVELCMLGYGNSSALVNDPRAQPRDWLPGNDVEDSQAAERANCVVLLVATYGVVLPVLVALRDIAPGEQLLRDYGPDWWRQLAAAWEVAEDDGLSMAKLLHGTQEQPAEEQPHVAAVGPQPPAAVAVHSESVITLPGASDMGCLASAMLHGAPPQPHASSMPPMAAGQAAGNAVDPGESLAATGSNTTARHMLRAEAGPDGRLCGVSAPDAVRTSAPPEGATSQASGEGWATNGAPAAIGPAGVGRMGLSGPPHTRRKRSRSRSRSPKSRGQDAAGRHRSRSHGRPARHERSDGQADAREDDSGMRGGPRSRRNRSSSRRPERGDAHARRRSRSRSRRRDRERSRSRGRRRGQSQGRRPSPGHGRRRSRSRERSRSRGRRVGRPRDAPVHPGDARGTGGEGPRGLPPDPVAARAAGAMAMLDGTVGRHEEAGGREAIGEERLDAVPRQPADAPCDGRAGQAVSNGLHPGSLHRQRQQQDAAAREPADSGSAPCWAPAAASEKCAAAQAVPDTYLAAGLHVSANGLGCGPSQPNQNGLHGSVAPHLLLPTAVEPAQVGSVQPLNHGQPSLQPSTLPPATGTDEQLRPPPKRARRATRWGPELPGLEVEAPAAEQLAEGGGGGGVEACGVAPAEEGAEGAGRQAAEPAGFAGRLTCAARTEDPVGAGAPRSATSEGGMRTAQHCHQDVKDQPVGGFTESPAEAAASQPTPAGEDGCPAATRPRHPWDAAAAQDLDRAFCRMVKDAAAGGSIRHEGNVASASVVNVRRDHAPDCRAIATADGRRRGSTDRQRPRAPLTHVELPMLGLGHGGDGGVPGATHGLSTLADMVSALGRALRLSAALQGRLLGPLGYLGRAAVVAAQQLLQRQGLPYVKGAVLRVKCAPLPGLKLRLWHASDAPLAWGELRVSAHFGELLDNVAAADQAARRSVACWAESLASFAHSLELDIDPDSMGPAAGAARQQEGGVGILLNGDVAAMYTRDGIHRRLVPLQGQHDADAPAPQVFTDGIREHRSYVQQRYPGPPPLYANAAPTALGTAPFGPA